MTYYDMREANLMAKLLIENIRLRKENDRLNAILNKVAAAASKLDPMASIYHWLAVAEKFNESKDLS